MDSMREPWERNVICEISLVYLNNKIKLFHIKFSFQNKFIITELLNLDVSLMLMEEVYT